MADEMNNATRFPQEPQKRMAAATAISMSALKPMLHFQISMLRMWADTLERFAGNYEKGLDETATAINEQADRERAA